MLTAREIRLDACSRNFLQLFFLTCGSLRFQIRYNLMNAVITWLHQPFNLLDRQVARLKLVIFCGLFGCMFLIIFQPFNLNLGFSEVNAPVAIIFAFFAIAGMAALSLTQFAFRSLFQVMLTTRLSFLLWSLVEFFFIALAIHTVDII